MLVEKIFRLDPRDILMFDVNYGTEYAINRISSLLCKFIDYAIRPFMKKKNFKFTVIRETPRQLIEGDNPYRFEVHNGLVGDGLKYLLTPLEAMDKINKHWFDYKIQISFDD